MSELDGVYRTRNADVRFKYASKGETILHQSSLLSVYVATSGRLALVTYGEDGEYIELSVACNSAPSLAAAIAADQKHREVARVESEEFRRVVANLEMLTELELDKLIERATGVRKGKSDV